MIPAVSIDRLVPAHVRGFEAYVPSRPDEELCRLNGVSYLHRLNNNENPLGPPPATRELLRDLDPHTASLYPSGDCWPLRGRLAELWQVDRDQVIVGNGANEVIGFVIKAFCETGDNIITADRTFAVAEWIANFSGIEARLAPLVDSRFNAAEILRLLDARTKIVFVCNPNNPTGTYWTSSELEGLLQEIAGRAIVVVDEAYAEYVAARDYPDTRNLLDRYPNLVVFRTFSKAWGLAGLRIGYLVGGRRLVDVVRRTAISYSINTIAQAAAMAALEDDGSHLARSRDLVLNARLVVERAMGDLGVPVISNEGNFMMLQLPVSDTAVSRMLMRRGFMVRAMTAFRYPSWIRVTLSHRELMSEFVLALSGVLTAAKSADGETHGP